jgi:anthranilate phosphoribosyltransferase
MGGLFDKMTSFSGFAKADFVEFFSNAAKWTPAEIGAILGCLLGRRNAEDAAALVAALRELHPQHDMRFIDRRPTVNMVGTGGGPSTFNITTTAAFVVAASGGVVVKTGGNARRSKSGFLDVAARLGTLKLAMSWEQIESIASDVGIVFVPPSHYPLALGQLEQTLTPSGCRNAAIYLNKLGPLLSPVRVGHQFIGANSSPCLEMLAGACRLLGDVPATLVLSDDGLDEVSSRANTTVIRLSAAGDETKTVVCPAVLGISPPALDALEGAAPAAAAACCERLLSGKGTAAQTDIVALNAAVVMTSTGLAADVHAGFHAARQLIENGEALRKLQRLRERVWNRVKC